MVWLWGSVGVTCHGVACSPHPPQVNAHSFKDQYLFYRFYEDDPARVGRFQKIFDFVPRMSREQTAATVAAVSEVRAGEFLNGNYTCYLDAAEPANVMLAQRLQEWEHAGVGPDTAEYMYVDLRPKSSEERAEMESGNHRILDYDKLIVVGGGDPMADRLDDFDHVSEHSGRRSFAQHSDGEEEDDDEAKSALSEAKSIAADDGDEVFDEDDDAVLEGYSSLPMFQRGVMRTNCVDCLDRTNVGQYCLGAIVLGRQIHALGLSDSPFLEPRGMLMNIVTSMYEQLGDRIAIQYGGSEAHKKVSKQHTKHEGPSEEPVSRAKGSASGGSGVVPEFLTSLKRYYNNVAKDALKQDAINVFLGVFEPRKQNVHIWELDNDVSIHSSLSMERVLSRHSRASSHESGAMALELVEYPEAKQQQQQQQVSPQTRPGEPAAAAVASPGVGSEAPVGIAPPSTSLALQVAAAPAAAAPQDKLFGTAVRMLAAVAGRWWTGPLEEFEASLAANGYKMIPLLDRCNCCLVSACFPSCQGLTCVCILCSQVHVVSDVPWWPRVQRVPAPPSEVPVVRPTAAASLCAAASAHQNRGAHVPTDARAAAPA